MPLADVAVRLARVLGTTVEELVTGTHPRKAPLGVDASRRLKAELVRGLTAVVNEKVDALAAVSSRRPPA
jgi:hypothetical protein